MYVAYIFIFIYRKLLVDVFKCAVFYAPPPPPCCVRVYELPYCHTSDTHVWSFLVPQMVEHDADSNFIVEGLAAVLLGLCIVNNDSGDPSTRYTIYFLMGMHIIHVYI